MARQFLTGLNLNKNELLNARIQNLANDPLNPVLGQIYFNTSLNEMRVYNGAEFEAVGLNGVTASAAEINVLDGVVITTDELNTLDGIDTNTTVQAQLDLKATIADPTFTGTVSVETDLVFEGSTADGFETVLRATDPTADHIITVPNQSGTLILSSDTVNELSAPTAEFSMNNQKITGLADPSEAQDAATKAYVDATAEGLSVKPAVMAATTEALSATYNNGVLGVGATLTATTNGAFPLIDGVQLTTVNGNRGLLVKNQANAFENGRYNLTTQGDANTPWVLTRCGKCDEASEIPSAYVFVQSGSTYASTGWVALVEDPAAFDVGVDDINWIQFSGAGTYEAGDGLTLDGVIFNVNGTEDRISVTANAVDIASTYVGQTSITTLGTIATGTWEADTLAVEYGGTGATDAAGAKTNLGFLTRYAATNDLLVPSSGVVTWTVTHNLGTRDVTVQVYDLLTYEEVFVDAARTNTNVVTLSWVAAANVNADSYRVVVVG